jgi:ribonuclease BN (tRNA processing enzyme)
MRLTVIGCAGSFPRADSPASCYLVEHDGFRLLLDMGNGSLGALQRHVAPTDVDAVLVSHLHTDHCVDLCSLDVYLRYHPDGRRPSVPVWTGRIG